MPVPAARCANHCRNGAARAETFRFHTAALPEKECDNRPLQLGLSRRPWLCRRDSGMNPVWRGVRLSRRRADPGEEKRKKVVAWAGGGGGRLGCLFCDRRVLAMSDSFFCFFFRFLGCPDFVVRVS